MLNVFRDPCYARLILVGIVTERIKIIDRVRGHVNYRERPMDLVEVHRDEDEAMAQNVDLQRKK